ncbi:MAG TPA: cobalt-precorrin 5A hydrolase [Ruminiclostridium sp.]
MKIKLVSFTKQGGKLCAKLQEELNRQGHCAVGYCKYYSEGTKLLDYNIKEFTENSFDTCGAIVYIGAVGIAVRAIAPFLKSKTIDPAVLVIDETARYVIPVLSGHIGGANDLAHTIASILSAQPIITTATDCNYRFAVDTWAVNNRLHIANAESIKHISAAILNGEQVGLYSDFPIEGDLPEGLSLSSNTRVGICISLVNKQIFEHTLQLIPKQYVLGIGCRKNTKYEDLLNFVNMVLMEYNISPHEVEAITSIDLKAEEEALLLLCRELRVPFYTYSAQELSLVSGEFAESSFVKATTGVGNVCERAAIKACNGKLLLRKTCSEGMTIAIAKKEWRCKF